MINNEPVWTDIQCTGASGENYFGRFQIRRFLTHREKTEAVRLAETLCRGITDSIEHRTFLTTIAFLSFHIIEVDAAWWGDKGLDLLDEEPVWELAKTVRALQKPPAEKPETPKA